jgi:hypothetical protein
MNMVALLHSLNLLRTWKLSEVIPLIYKELNCVLLIADRESK